MRKMATGLALAVVGVLGLAATSQAMVIRSIDMSAEPSWRQSEIYGFTEVLVGTPPVLVSPTTTTSITSGALVGTFNVAGSPPEWGEGSGIYKMYVQDSPSNVVNPAVSNVLSDYEISFDASALGLVSPSAGIRFILRFQDWSVELADSITVTSTPTTFTFNLFAIPVVGGSWGAAPSTRLNTGTMQLDLESGWPNVGADVAFGLDNGNKLVLDNVVVQVVPEPASLSLLGLVSLAALRRRRSA